MKKQAAVIDKSSLQVICEQDTFNRIENKTTVGVDGLADFGEYLNGLYDTSVTCELENEKRCLESCSIEDVIAGFQAFYNGKTKGFKVRIESIDQLANKTFEFKKGESV